VLREPQRILEVERVAKYLLPEPEWNLTSIAAIQVEQMEEIEPHRNPAEQLGRRMLDLHSCSFVKLVMPSLNVTISPSAMKDSVRCR
jgi:hypothetical protein